MAVRMARAPKLPQNWHLSLHLKYSFVATKHVAYFDLIQIMGKLLFIQCCGPGSVCIRFICPDPYKTLWIRIRVGEYLIASNSSAAAQSVARC